MKIIISKLLLMVIIVSCVFTGVASAERFYGNVYGNDGKPISGKNVVIEKSDGWGISSQLNDGKYDKSTVIPTSRYTQYIMKIDGKEIERRDLKSDDWKEEWHFDFRNWQFHKDYSCKWDHNNPPNNIPEFPTVALPIAALIGLIFFFQHRKSKKD